MTELPHASIPASALAQLTVDATLPVCNTCATQYPAPRDDCELRAATLERSEMEREGATE